MRNHIIKENNGSDSRRNDVYAWLHDSIINLSFKPGTALSEKEIGLELKVSRTPVREALILLAKENLVEIRPQIGTYVSLIDPALVEEARFMREALETAVIKLAAEKMDDFAYLELEKIIGMQKLVIKEGNYKAFLRHDDDFHGTIFRCMGKEKTWNAINQLNTHFKRIRFLRLSTTEPTIWEEILEEHEELLDALNKKDAALAEKKMKEHLTKSIAHIDELKSKYPNYFKF